MQRNTRFISRSLSLVALSAAMAAPFASPSEAKPPRQAPAYGYGNGNGRRPQKDKGDRYGNASERHDRRSDDDNGYDDNSDVDNNNGDIYGNDNGDPRPGYDNSDVYGSGTGYNTGGTRDRRSFEGVVTRDLGGNRFEMRAADNSLFTVRVRQGEPQSISRGDRVRVSGYFRTVRNDNRGPYNNDARADFVAESLQILNNVSNGGGYGGNYGGGYGTGSGTARTVSFPGTVLNRDSSRRLLVRGDNGRTYTVETRSNTVRVDDGDRVRVQGTSRGGVITNARVELLRNTDNPIYNGTDDTFLGTVSRVDTRNNLITVRDQTTGRTYTFRPKQASDFRVGGRVQGTVSVRDGRSVLTKVTRL